MQLIRYCDDFVVAFESLEDAESFLKELRERFAKFGLQVAEGKTRFIEFGKKSFNKCKQNKIKNKSFNFLGFTHFMKESRYGKTIMGHKTSKDNLNRKLQTIKEWLKVARIAAPLHKWIPVLKAKLIGHYNYYGLSENFRCLKQFYHRVIILTYKWANRRSQRKSFNWNSFAEYLKIFPLPLPKIKVNLYRYMSKG